MASALKLKLSVKIKIKHLIKYLKFLESSFLCKFFYDSSKVDLDFVHCKSFAWLLISCSLSASDESVCPSVVLACGVSDGAVKRKACKNCTCGLAEQLDTENQQQQTKNTSSCGNVTKSAA